MNKKFIILISAVLILIGTSSFILKISSGIAGYTGSPGESTCGGCHGGGFGPTVVGISSVPNFSGNIYSPGTTYTINISVSNSIHTRYSFGCEILNTKDSSAGVMSNPFAGVKFLNAFNGRENAVHTNPKTGSGSATFSFVWTAATNDSVTIYAAGNAVNMSNNTGGDMSGSTFLALVPDPSLGSKEEFKTVIMNVNIYPNPVSEVLNLSYFLSKTAEVKAALYDLKGNEIQECFAGKQSVGFKSINIDLSTNVSAGIYLLKFNVDGKLTNSKLIIIN